jgi:hypothetical protein
MKRAKSNKAIRVTGAPSRMAINRSRRILMSILSLVDPTQGGTLANQPADTLFLEATLLSARKIAEELGEAVVLYLIDMAIQEAKMKSSETANDHKPQARKQSRGSRGKTDMSSRVWSVFTV